MNTKCKLQLNSVVRVGLLAVVLAWTTTANSAENEVCNLDASKLPEQCLRFERSCPVLQSCVMDWVLRNDDIENFDVGTLALKPLDKRAGSADEHTVYSQPQAPVVVEQSPVIPQACRDDVMLAVTEDFAQVKGLPFRSAEQRMQRHMKTMQKRWRSQGWALQPNQVFAHLHECRDLCGAMIARLAQCHIWAVSNADLKSLVTFEVNQYDRDSIRDSYPFSVDRFVNSLPALSKDTQRRYHVAVIGRASRDGDAQHNYDLSYKRAHTVRSYLLELGLPNESVRLVWLGEQSPQIHAAMVEGYELDSLYRSLGEQRDLRINRSVLLVAYPVDEAHEAHEHEVAAYP